ncbi:MAG: S8 family serine peptidase [Coriobacteriia bacterium]|nr:S8 family serine peptidase [Coriobacteriia bacterium]
MMRSLRMARAVVACVLAAAITVAIPMPGVASPQAVETGPGRVIVAWTDVRDEGRVRARLAGWGLGEARRLYGERGLVLDAPAGVSAEALARTLSAIPGVAYAEPDHPVKALWTAGTPNDPAFADGTQWAPRRIQAESAWELTRGNDVLVAVVDTGVALDHEDLAAHMWINPGEIPGNSIDDDDNGFVDDVAGWDFVNQDGKPDDDNGHGTHCAGIAAAVTDNGRGIAGMAPGARILPVKVLDSRGSGSSAVLAEGIDYAVDAGADVVSVSVGGSIGSLTVAAAVARARSAGVLVVAAAGNEGGAVLYPAAYPETMCVGATDAADVRTTYSNYGSAMDIVAPGGTSDAAVYSTVRYDGYGTKYGTSMATPHVAGVAALLLGERPHLSPEALRFLIGSTATDLGSQGRDDYYGDGLVQARSAIDLMLADSTPPESTCTTRVAPPEGVEIAIDADDVGLGVDRVAWTLDGTTTGVGDRIELTYPGEHTLQYAAVDLAGNREATRSVTVSVTDTLPPVTTSDARSAYYGGSAMITLAAADRGIGVATTVWSLDGAPSRTGTVIKTTVIGDHELAFKSVDLLGHEEATQTVEFRVWGTADVQRINGVDRYGTAVAASGSAFANGAGPVVVMASGQDFPDALAACGLAGVLDAPVLLTRPNALPPGVVSELERLGTGRVVLVGGIRAIGDSVKAELDAAGIEVERVAGADRYETAAAVAAQMAVVTGPSPAVTFIVRGDDFADALAVAPLAHQRGYPVLLTRPDALPRATEIALDRLSPGAIVIAGGVAAVDTIVAGQVGAVSGVTVLRIGGDTRYSTAALVADRAHSEGWADGVYAGVATGVDYPDALSGGAAAGAHGGVMILTAPTSLSAEAGAYIRDHIGAGGPVRVFGGTAAVSAGVVTELRAIPLL